MNADALPPDLVEALGAYLDEEAGEAELRRAGDIAKHAALDIATLLDWIRTYSATTERRARAQVVMRAALNLPLIPGPVCRSAS